MGLLRVRGIQFDDRDRQRILPRAIGDFRSGVLVSWCGHPNLNHHERRKAGEAFFVVGSPGAGIGM
jgi:hypothetical protein